MLGNKWEQAQGTIVDAQTVPKTGRGVGAAMQVEHRYVVEVRKPTGEVISGTVIDTSPGGYAVGTVIGVQVQTKSGDMKLDPNQRVVSVSAMINTMDQLAGLEGPIGPYSHGPSAGNVLRILGPGGQELPVQMDPGEISRLAQAIRSGDPATKQAAMNQLRDMRDRARAQVAGQLGGGLAPGASAAAVRAGFFQSGQPAQPGQPGYPSPAPPAGAFGSGGGPGSAEERLAQIKQLLDKGILSESEYQAKRQQIIDEL
jgi:putative oligomerization/nucleic acid binding protein